LRGVKHRAPKAPSLDIVTVMRALAVALLLLAQAPPPQASLRDALDAAVQASRIKDGRAGILVHSVREGRAVYGLQEREPFLLASNTKLFTTAAALARLGPRHVFRTPVGLVGEDLHVFGAGDPNISGRFHDDDPLAVFKRWAARLKAAGVAKVADVVLHTGAFEGPALNPGWKDYDPWWWWAAPFGPLSLNDNCVDLTIEPGADGEPARVRLSPDTGYVRLVNNTRSAKRAAKPFGFTRRAGTNTITLAGDVAGRATYSVTIHDPALYFGTVLVETLAREGISSTGRLVESKAPIEETPGFREVDAAEHGLPETLAACNQPSQNYYAEMLLRVLAWKTRGKGTLENGLAAVREFAEKDARVESLAQADGSGLTRENRAAAADVVKLLLHMRAHENARVFLDSLPVNGAEKGTLRRRLLAPELRGRVRAKTGHVAGVSTLSGYVDAKNGDTFVFSILVNAPSGGDQLQDRICEILARQ
jgi:D-alanyl-D-alanine carboxypeptidase/D-alanyl-D-alanine-endopeptidase (penicillin-binding protein 4)